MEDVIDQILLHSKSFENSDFRQFLKSYKNEVLNGSIPVVLFGAGAAGNDLYPIFRSAGIYPQCFCDNNTARVGSLHCGLPIISVSELMKKHMNSLIIITIGSQRGEVRDQLVDLGFDQEKILDISDQEILFYYSFVAHQDWHWSRKELESHRSKLQAVYSALSDNKSREIFCERIALFTGAPDFKSFKYFISNFSEIPDSDTLNRKTQSDSNITSAYLQFTNDIFHLGDHELLLDGGAFIGDSTIEFIKACKTRDLEYRKVICYEPERRIFSELKRNLSSYENIDVRPFGLWSEQTTLNFFDTNLLNPGCTRIETVMNNAGIPTDGSRGITEILTTSIDEDCEDEKPISIIKMDIEGAEVEALHGAAKTIIKYKPKLIISAYHRRDDLWEIPLLIKKLVPEYALYFRHFSNFLDDTMLFAIPN